MGEVSQITKNVDLIKIIQFRLKIYDLWRHLHPWVVGCISGSMGGSGQITKN